MDLGGRQQRMKQRIARSNKRAESISGVNSSGNASFGKRRKTLISAIGNSDLGQKVINRREEKIDTKMKSVGISDEDRNQYFAGRQRRRVARGIQGGNRQKF